MNAITDDNHSHPNSQMYEPAKWKIYQRVRVSRVADTELVLLIAHLNPTTRFNSWFWINLVIQSKHFTNIT